MPRWEEAHVKIATTSLNWNVVVGSSSRVFSLLSPSNRQDVAVVKKGGSHYDVLSFALYHSGSYLLDCKKRPLR